MSGNKKADYYLWCVAKGFALGLPVNLRNNLDPWFAHEAGTPFLKDSGRHHTFDNPCAWEHGHRLRHDHFWVTPEAEAVLDAGRRRDPEARKDKGRDDRYRLKVDHAVPFEVLQGLLASALVDVEEPRWIPTLRELLHLYFRRGVLTQEQDSRLSNGIRPGERLNSKMPRDWDQKDPFARYRAMGFERVRY